MRPFIKNLFFLVTFATVMWFGYVVFFSEDAMVLVDNTANQARIAEGDFLAQLKELRDLKLNASLFDDAEFLSLTDQRVDVVDEDAGRANPFAPVPGLDITTDSTGGAVRPR